MRRLRQILHSIGAEVYDYARSLRIYVRRRGYHWFSKFEFGKDIVVDLLYKQRGRYSRPFLHFGIVTLTFVVITLGPLILDESQRQEVVDQGSSTGGVLQAARAFGGDLTTSQSEEVRQFRGGEVTTHRVQEGETLSSIANLYNLRVETILWENSLTKDAKLKPGQELRILPIDGVRHKVARGETIYTLAKKYDLGDDAADAQKIVNYPFNDFKNSETFELAIGQTLLIPDGIKPEERAAPRASFARVLTPGAVGEVSAQGFIWPTAGKVTQGYSFYHKALDIANRGGGPIQAADGGTVIAAGWDNSGYGNRVMIDHGNGFVTLYAHMSVLQVQQGQKVARGNVVGQMGSTGRSTGTHLHFEIRRGSVLENPNNFLGR